MSVKRVAAQYLKSFFKFGQSIARPIQYIAINRSQSYNTDTGTVSGAPTTYDITVMINDYRSEDIGNREDIQAGDQRCIIQAGDLPLGFIPMNADSIVDDEGVQWNIENWKKDPSRTSFVLQLRRP